MLACFKGLVNRINVLVHPSVQSRQETSSARLYTLNLFLCGYSKRPVVNSINVFFLGTHMNVNNIGFSLIQLMLSHAF